MNTNPEPNTAIIRYSDDSFLQIQWDSEDGFVGEEFTTSPDDGYNDLSYHQMMFSSFDEATDTSISVQSFTISNDEDTRLRDVEPQELIKIIEHLLVEEFQLDLTGTL